MIYRQFFHCVLQSDIVLSSRGATEGFVPALNYIPGARFLGLVASSLYDMGSAAQTLDIFHNGT